MGFDRIFEKGHSLDSYLVLLRVEFTLLPTVTGGTVRSYRTLSPLPDPLWAIGGLLSAALVVGSRLPDVIRHSALCSPDFPPAYLSPRLHLREFEGFNRPAIA